MSPLADAVSLYCDFAAEVDEAFDEIDMHAHRTRPYKLAPGELGQLRRMAKKRTVDRHVRRRTEGER